MENLLWLSVLKRTLRPRRSGVPRALDKELSLRKAISLGDWFFGLKGIGDVRNHFDYRSAASAFRSVAGMAL
jgi:hypothetical protein